MVALERAGIEVTSYCASEVDAHAIKVSNANYPQIIRLGDVRVVKASELPQIDLLIGGSPCQGFSFAGKQLNFDDPRSKLFFEFVRLLRECKPRYFLLENVKMKKEYQDVISDALGVQPILINSSLVSAQNRNRLYWTNIPDVAQPDDKGLLFANIKEHDATTPNSEGWHAWFEANKDFQLRKKYCAVLGPEDKAITMTARQFASYNGNITPVLGGYRNLTPVECERLQTVPDGYTDSVSDTQRYRMLGNGWTVDVIAHFFRSIPSHETRICP